MLYTIYTDGACSGNKRDAGCDGAWAYVVCDIGKNKVLEGSGLVHNTTNNRMELSAVINALVALIDNQLNGNIIIISDSKYVCDGYTVYLPGWKQNGWRKSDGKPVMNVDLWKQLDSLVPDLRICRFQWVKGHHTNKMNNLVDSMAQKLLGR